MPNGARKLTAEGSALADRPLEKCFDEHVGVWSQA
jgi:hypothetical protein